MTQTEELAIAFDWIELILEVQTEPEEGLAESHGRLYELIYAPLALHARRWLETRSLAEVENDALVSVAVDKTFRDIGKFEIRDDCPVKVERSFKAWVNRCAEHEWSKWLRSTLSSKSVPFEEAMESEDFQLLSPEQEEETPTERSAERELMKRALEEELNKLPLPIRAAILETVGVADVSNPGARGPAGETARIAEKYGYTPQAIRTRKSRLVQRVRECKERLEKGSKS